MTAYAACECAGCYRRLSRKDAHQIAGAGIIERASRSWRFSSKSRARAAGRRSSDEKGWLCSDCYAAGAQRRERWVLIGAIGVIGCIALMAGVFASVGKKQNPGTAAKEPQAASSLALPVGPNPPSSGQSLLSASPRSAAPSERAGQHSQLSLMPDSSARAFNADLSDAGNAIRAQARLIELGYLKAFADGRWGPKSRAALRAFKRANGLPADDEWDDTTASQLFDAHVARAPRDPPPAAASR